MNITQESTGELTAAIKIELGQNDYQEKVNNSLKELQKKSSLKGFRPGKVPFGLIKKMYEKSVVAEEVNKLLSDSLNNHITENKLEILGYPLGDEEKNKKVDLENNTEYEFYFDIGFVPDFNLDISENTSMEYYNIKVEDTILENYLEDSRRRFGSFVESETVEEGDFIQGEICEVDENGQIKEEGIKKDTSISLKHIKEEKIKQDFIGKKIGDKIVFNPLKATDSVIETTSMLGLKKDEIEKTTADFEFTITKITRIEPAAIDQELFNKVYPGTEIEDEKQFREKLAGEANSYYQVESENYFVHATMEKLINDTHFNLPDDFIKRWLVDSDANITPESVEKDYPNYVKSLKNQLIINKIRKDHNINVEEQEIKDYVRGILLKRYNLGTVEEEKENHLNSIVASVLKNKGEATKIYDQLFDNKIRELFKSKFKLDKKDVTYADFINLVNEHHKIHHHEHED
jgi:trigger factor